MKYQVEILQDNQSLFKATIDNINQAKADDALAILLGRFPIEMGFTKQIMRSETEIRYLKCTATNIEVLAIEPIFKAMDLD
ncbi:hypothetical protein [Shewanella frigidimarina]|uniref:hypothetical protein n=1 Tax=Shewanella frigidimarina TaxID=56812 RepID=UPI003D79D9EF